MIRFRATGRFVIAYAQGFLIQGSGITDAAASADQIWMEPKSPFGPAGAGAGAIFLRGFVRQDFKPCRRSSSVPTTRARPICTCRRTTRSQTASRRRHSAILVQQRSGCDRRGAQAEPQAVIATLQADPQFADNAQRAHFVDRLGYDGQAKDSARARAGHAKFVLIGDYARATDSESTSGDGPRVALIEAAGEIVDGATQHSAFGGNTVIAGDDYADAFRSAARDKRIKAILFRIDSPGGSVTASDQILEALKEAKAAGKPVIVSMGPLAASGGYYVSSAADEIVAEPATLTGSIGVLTGKVSIGKSLGLIGVGADEIGVGTNALMDSGIEPYTPEQLQNLNAQADTIYEDFMQKVAAGRKLPLAQVQKIAKGRVWTGADAQPRGLVDELGTFWTAVGEVKKRIGVSPDVRLTFRTYPREGRLPRDARRLLQWQRGRRSRHRRPVGDDARAGGPGGDWSCTGHAPRAGRTQGNQPPGAVVFGFNAERFMRRRGGAEAQQTAVIAALVAATHKHRWRRS